MLKIIMNVILTGETKQNHKVPKEFTYIQDKLTPRLDSRKTGSPQIIFFLSNSKMTLMLKPRLLSYISIVLEWIAIRIAKVGNREYLKSEISIAECRSGE